MQIAIRVVIVMLLTVALVAVAGILIDKSGTRPGGDED